MNKKVLVFSLFAIGTLLASCTNNDDTESSADVSSESSTSSRQTGGFVSSPTTISIWHTSSYETTLDSFAEAFKAIEPNVTIEFNKISGSYDGLADQIIQGFGANNYPDMFLGYPDAVQSMIEYGKVVQLDDYIDNAQYGWTAAEKEDIISNYLKEGQSYSVEGTYSLPFMKSTEAMFYNKDILALDLSSIDSTINGGKPISEEYLNNLTWEDLFDHLCPALISYNNNQADDRKFYKPNSTYTQAIFGYDSDANLFITLAEQYGYGYTSVNQTTGAASIDFVNDGMKGLMKTFNKAYQNGYFFTKNSSNGGNYTNHSFTNNAAIFSIGSTGGTKYQVSDNFTTGVAKIPHAAGKSAKVINQGPSLAVLDHNDANKELAAWLFYKFMTNEDNAPVLAVNTGYLPVRYSAYDSEEYAEIQQTEGKTGAELVLGETATYAQTVANDLYASPVFKGSAKARTAVDTLVGDCVSAKGDDAAVTTKINEAFNTAYQTALAALA